MDFTVFQNIFNNIIHFFDFFGNGVTVVIIACVIIIIVISVKRGVTN